ncbi:YbhB/YbcL family Raf kinase inhibitor-like protein [Basilea psittacipulmonis]|uniref:Phospholipid-binding protein n=1 Tax=Basilea psittacipulmonis DSM 24701 TaxID=1072685 RepID=A0A077DGT1_9BURK|nr:YbhB/YbcL family Raf kinase inhibitor-like protein [Basilea psittacipulmonis]AIL32373.1 hypothetical protein IX83_02725 [Basilea psittacipulmonis DSM 24701]
MKLSSQAIQDGKRIDPVYAFCRLEQTEMTLSDNISPDLSWSDVPAGTLSFAVVVHDPDAPSVADDVNQTDKVIPEDFPRADFYHLLIWDIPKEVTELPKGALSNGIVNRGKSDDYLKQGSSTDLQGAKLGVNDYTAWFKGDESMQGNYFSYDGPCPPFNDERVHRYYFTVYALSVETLNLTEKAVTGPQLLSAIKPYVLGQATLVGTYTLNARLA